jgi:uncharacterized protein (DUF927 family)
MRRVNTHSSRLASSGHTSISHGEADDTPLAGQADAAPNVLSKKGHLKSEGESSKFKTTTNLDPLTRWETEYEHFAGKNEEGNCYLVIIKRSEEDNSDENVIAVLPYEEASSDGGRFFKELAKKGFAFLSRREKDQILKSLQCMDPDEERCRIACRSGWLSGAFVTPGYTVYPAGSPVKIYLSLPAAQQVLSKKLQSSGTLDDWLKEVGRFCQGNTRLMFAVSLALVQPLLDLIRPEQGGFLLFGRSGRGKTTVLIVAGSAWGNDPKRPLGYCESWNHTPNNLEALAASHNDMFLPLDETRTFGDGSKSRGAAYSSAIMRLSGGEEKGRLVPGDGPNAWRSIFLGTTNLTVHDILTAGGEAVDDAHYTRAIDIPLPANGHGIFENLHGFESVGKFSKYLKEACNRQYGTLIREFLQRLVQERADDEAGLTERLEQWRQRYIQRANEVIGSDPLIERFHERFATVYLGARLAIKFGLLPWDPKKLREAILTCEQDHFRLRGEPARRDGDGLAALKAYVSAQRSQMIELQPGKAQRLSKLAQAPGFLWTEGGDSIVGLERNQLVSLCGGKSAADRVLKLLNQQGALVSERKGDPLKAQQKQMTTKKDEKQFRPYLYMIKADALK